MGKDHKPTDVSKINGYITEIDYAESESMVKRVNTSFGSQNHNVYIHRDDGTHEHFYYAPERCRSGWHGNNWETRSNHPNIHAKTSSQFSDGAQPLNPKDQGKGNDMEKNSFIESIKVDKATIDRCNEVSLSASKNANAQSENQVNTISDTHNSRVGALDYGGREVGDMGPASLGRESGYKEGLSDNNVESEQCGDPYGIVSQDGEDHGTNGCDINGHETDGGQGDSGQCFGGQGGQGGD